MSDASVDGVIAHLDTTSELDCLAGTLLGVLLGGSCPNASQESITAQYRVGHVRDSPFLCARRKALVQEMLRGLFFWWNRDSVLCEKK